MVKGIQKGLLVFVLAGMSFGAFALSDDGKYKLINKLCGKIDGNINNYGSPTKFKNEDGEICWSIQCKAQTGKAGSDYNATVNTETRCYTEEELFGRISGDFDANVDIDGLGTKIVVNGETVTVGSDRWRALCVKKDGTIRGICGGGSTGGDISVSTDGGLKLPKRCFNIFGKIKKKCKIEFGIDVDVDRSGYRIYTDSDGYRWKCTAGESLEDCMGDSANLISTTIDGGFHCTTGQCGNSSRRSGAYGVLSGIAELVGASGNVVGPIMGYLGTKAQANAYLGAVQSGYENCQLMQTNYVQSTYNYISSNGLPDRDVSPPMCNGYNLGMYAGGMGFMGNGMGGFGNPWMSAGYSPGFTSGMYGPYGMYNPYGSVNGMYNNGMFNNGMSSPGWPPITNGNIYNNGMNNNGMMNCFTYPCPGSTGGWTGGPGGGFNIGLNTGYNGYNNGYNGYFGNPWNGSAAGNGVVPWNNGNGSYWNGSGGWGNNGYNNWGNIQASYNQNAQAYNQGQYYQQMALQNQYNNAAQNLWSNGYGMNNYNYGYAGYSPMNMGVGLNLGLGFNF